MASVTDYGKLDIDPLANPKLGGNDGWAAAVSAALDDKDTTVDARIVDGHQVAVGTSTPVNQNVLLWVDEGSNYP
jgi:hypothetical protein